MTILKKVISTSRYSGILLLMVVVIASFLRLWHISSVPVSLYSDEVDLGYQAYSILHSGKDYFGNPWPLNFHSYADYRTPLNIYFTVPFVFIFGITPLAIRLPSVIFGVATVFLMYFVVKEILSYSNIPATKHPRALLAAFILAISPWHIQYSRVTLEVSSLLFFLLMGVFLFYRSLKKPKILPWSVLFIGITPYIYSTAKFFAPLFILFLFLNWSREILNLQKKYLFKAFFAGLIVSVPIYSSILFGNGAERAKYTSVFSDPTIGSEVIYRRTFDAKQRGDLEIGYSPKFIDKFFHNKLDFVREKVSANLLNAFSFDFLFIKGDPNLRHSPEGVGQFYRIESVALMLGLIFFFTSKLVRQTKIFILFWLILGALTSSITREGGNHATRLILMLPPIVFLISFGIVETAKKLNGSLKIFLLATYFTFLFAEFIFYLHNFYVHYPWDSERWWNYGYKEMIESVKMKDRFFDKVIISNSAEPPEIFLAAYYPIEPSLWQKGLADDNMKGFGGVKNIGKFYFGKISEFDKLGTVLDSEVLYVASSNETKDNLYSEPEKKPDGIKILQVVRYQSGDPAFYLLAKENKTYD